MLQNQQGGKAVSNRRSVRAQVEKKKNKSTSSAIRLTAILSSRGTKGYIAQLTEEGGEPPSKLKGG